MTTFADMQAAVYEQTKRPELVALTKSAIRMATLRAHHTDFFLRDRTSIQLNWVINPSELWHDFADIWNVATRLRTPTFMQARDAINTELPTENLEFVGDFQNFWDEWNAIRSSVFCLVGGSLRARFAVATGVARLFYFQNPDVTDAGYSSWIADAHMDEVALWAAAIVWMRSGFQEIAKGAKDHIQDFKELLITSYLSSAKV